MIAVAPEMATPAAAVAFSRFPVTVSAAASVILPPVLVSLTVAVPVMGALRVILPVDDRMIGPPVACTPVPVMVSVPVLVTQTPTVPAAGLELADRRDDRSGARDRHPGRGGDLQQVPGDGLCRSVGDIASAAGQVDSTLFP
jgi:hypothetical protein